MDRPLTAAETLVGFAPVLLPVCAIIVLRGRDVDEAGTDRTHYIPLLAKRWFWNCFCLVVGGAATWAFVDALLDAWRTGLVSLPGRRGHSRPVVAWPQAWAYFLGMAQIALGTLGSRTLPRRANLYALYMLGLAMLVFLGYVLFLLSAAFSSLKNATAVLIFLGGVTATFAVDRFVGRLAALALFAAFVFAFLFLRA